MRPQLCLLNLLAMILLLSFYHLLPPPIRQGISPAQAQTSVGQDLQEMADYFYQRGAEQYKNR